MVQLSIPTDELINAVGDRFANTSPTYGAPDKLQVGTGAQTPSASATALTNVAPISYTEIDDCDATTSWSASTDGAITLNTTSGEFIEGTGSLNLRKTGVTVNTVTYSKTTPTQDFTSKTVRAWIFLSDLSLITSVEIRYGSDSSNYYSVTTPVASLVVGGQWLKVTSSDTATGTPSIAACDYFAITIVTPATSTTWSSNEVRLDHVQINTASNEEASLYSGPTHSATTDTVKSTARLGLAAAIGQPLTNAAWKLSSGQIYGIDQFLLDDKSQEEEWELVESTQFINIP